MKDLSPKREIKETTSLDNRIESKPKIIGEPVKSNIFNATMASAKTFEEQKGVGNTSHNEHTTLSKTPSIKEAELAVYKAAAEEYLISPNIFKKKHQSRFKFAHSVDPFNKIEKHFKTITQDGVDGEEI